ncbi:MAG: hypothetical protein ACRD0A_17790 [Acidimicrobiales bacterium]
MDDDDDNDFESAEEVEFDSDWLPINMEGRMDLTEDWVTYLAQTDPPSNVEGVDTSIVDLDEGQPDGQQEVNYA